MSSLAEMEAARRLARECAREMPSRGRIGRTGRHTMRVPASAFFNAIEANGGVQKDGRTVWDDPEWCRDVARLHPECRVAYDGPRVFRLSEIKPSSGLGRNRFGRVTWRRVYSDNHKVVAGEEEGGGGR